MCRFALYFLTFYKKSQVGKSVSILVLIWKQAGLQEGRGGGQGEKGSGLACYSNLITTGVEFHFYGKGTSTGIDLIMML